MKNTTEKIKKSQLTAEAHINKLLAFAQKNKAALAIYRLPNDSTLRVICDLSGGQFVSELNLEDLPSGFLMHPFNVSENKIVHFEADIIADIELENSPSEKASTTQINWIKSPGNDIEEEIQSITSQFEFDELEKSTNACSTSKAEYIKMVEDGISYIQEEKFYKVVPSKIKNVAFENDINVGLSLLEACQKYLNAFVSLTYSSKTGMWFGASPETLIEDKRGDYFKTMALAGTQAMSEKSIAETSWTQKEIEEQAYVSRYIINCFKKIRLRDFDEIGPKTVQAGNLLHLKTTFKVDTQKVNFPELGSVMLKLLHPTSAICGMPKDSSLEFLSREEKHNRSFFSGYLGPVHLNDYNHLFVNLRCCQINNESVTFYAGAGITEDSQPAKEWEETEMKCKVLSDIILRK